MGGKCVKNVTEKTNVGAAKHIYLDGKIPCEEGEVLDTALLPPPEEYHHLDELGLAQPISLFSSHFGIFAKNIHQVVLFQRQKIIGLRNEFSHNNTCVNHSRCLPRNTLSAERETREKAARKKKTKKKRKKVSLCSSPHPNAIIPCETHPRRSNHHHQTFWRELCCGERVIKEEKRKRKKRQHAGKPLPSPPVVSASTQEKGDTYRKQEGDPSDSGSKSIVIPEPACNIPWFIYNCSQFGGSMSSSSSPLSLSFFKAFWQYCWQKEPSSVGKTRVT